MEEDERKSILEVSGAELVSLACSLAICFAKKYDKNGLCSLRLFFQSVASNISIIELQDLTEQNAKK